MLKRPATEDLEVRDTDGQQPTHTPKRLRSEDYDAKDITVDELSKTPPVENGDAVSVSKSTVEDSEKHTEDKKDDVASGSEDEDESPAIAAPPRPTGPAEGFSDLYLDTVNRAVLDFDFEKLCSVSLSNINVYACLVCGKYYQGRGRSSYAYTHSLDADHHVFININSLKVYVLPESYEVKNKTLDDVKYVVNPTYTKEDVKKLDTVEVERMDLMRRKYRPGFVGLNNIKNNDYFNVIIHALAHVAPLRNYFMLEDLRFKPELGKQNKLNPTVPRDANGSLVQRFSTLLRKIYNPRAFKSHVSPHELLQEISLRSSKRFTLLTQSDPVDFLHWFLHNLHLSLGGSKTRPLSSIVQKSFQGRLKIESQAITARADLSDRLRFEESGKINEQISRFLVLTLDLPPRPIFKDEMERNVIPQVPLTTILKKYDGLHPQELQGQRRRYRLLHPLPPYLIFHIKRFSTNKFVAERNNTIVTFNPRSLDMSPFVEPDSEHPGSGGEPILYDLVANVTHETVVESGKKEGELKSVFKVQVVEKSTGRWREIQDLVVKEVQRELLFTGESYVMVWERRREGRKAEAGKEKV